MSEPQRDIVFRRLDANDASAMYGLETQCFSLPWSAEQCRQAFTQKSFAAFGLWMQGNLLAYISIYHVCDEFEILNLAVIPQERGKGHGRRILQTALQIASKMGMKSVALEVRSGNFVAISLYESCGFVRTGCRPHYYPDTDEDAIVMTFTSA